MLMPTNCIDQNGKLNLIFSLANEAIEIYVCGHILLCGNQMTLACFVLSVSIECRPNGSRSFYTNKFIYLNDINSCRVFGHTGQSSTWTITAQQQQIMCAIQCSAQTSHTKHAINMLVYICNVNSFYLNVPALLALCWIISFFPFFSLLSSYTYLSSNCTMIAVHRVPDAHIVYSLWLRLGIWMVTGNSALLVNLCVRPLSPKFEWRETENLMINSINLIVCSLNFKHNFGFLECHFKFVSRENTN